MSKKQIAVLAVIVIVAIFFAVRIIRNAMTSEEAKIKKLVKELAEDFEQKKFSKIFDHITDDYKDDGGNTKDTLKENAKNMLLVINEIDLSISNLRAVVSADKKYAEAGLKAKIVLSTKFGDYKPFKAGEEELIFYLRRENGEWMLYKSNLKQYGDEF